MNSEVLASVAGIALSLAFSYIPGLKNSFERLSREAKQMTMGLMLVAVAGAVFSLSCAGLDVGVSCSQTGAIGLVQNLVAALVANQSTYLITRE